MAKIIINGTTYEVQGSNISINNGNIIVNGNTVISGLTGPVKVEWSGPLANLDAKGSVTVYGNVEGNVNCGGSFGGGNVKGHVDAGGSVSCGTVGGDVDAGGSISMKK